MLSDVCISSTDEDVSSTSDIIKIIKVDERDENMDDSTWAVIALVGTTRVGGISKDDVIMSKVDSDDSSSSDEKSGSNDDVGENVNMPILVVDEVSENSIVAMDVGTIRDRGVSTIGVDEDCTPASVEEERNESGVGSTLAGEEDDSTVVTGAIEDDEVVEVRVSEDVSTPMDGCVDENEGKTLEKMSSVTAEVNTKKTSGCELSGATGAARLARCS